jgi:hypothetical protein
VWSDVKAARISAEDRAIPKSFSIDGEAEGISVGEEADPLL